MNMQFIFMALFLCWQYAAYVPVDSREHSQDPCAGLRLHLVPSTWGTAEFTCPLEGYEYKPCTGSCYKFHGAAQAWLPSQKTCHDEGGHLAIINNQAESNVLKEIHRKNKNDITGASNADYISIGFMRLGDNEWVTLHGETLDEAGFSVWSPGEPNNQAGEEHCGSISTDGLLNDARCNNARAFICEITP